MIRKTCGSGAGGEGEGDGFGSGDAKTGLGWEVGLGGACAVAGPQAAANAAARAHAAMRLQGGRWELEVRPERGGRVTSLRLDGEELLDQGIGVDQPTASGFVEGGAWGWDEMVPNLDPAGDLPDHGEAWRLPWAIAAHDGSSLAMSCEGRLVPWRLRRRISLGRTVEVRYSYTNAGSGPHDAYWCAHPLFKLDAAMDAGAPIPAEGLSRKHFLPAGSTARCRLGWPSGTAIAVSWDASLCPDVAIWLCNGDLGGYRQIAIEPSWSKPAFPPGKTYSWWLRISAL